MTRNLLLGVGLAGLIGVVGCDPKGSTGSSTPADKMKEGAKNAGEKLKDLGEKAKDGAENLGDKVKDAAAKSGPAIKEGAEKLGDKIKEGAEKVGEKSKEAYEKVKAEFIKPIIDAYPDYETKMKGLTGDAATKAKEKYELVKKYVKEFSESPADKGEEIKVKLKEAIADLKKTLGL